MSSDAVLAGPPESTSKERPALDKSALRAALRWGLGLVLAEVALLLLMLLDVAAREHLRVVADLVWPRARGSMWPIAVLSIASVGTAFFNVFLLAWLPSKLVDRVFGPSETLRLAVGVPPAVLSWIVAYVWTSVAAARPTGWWWLPWTFSLVASVVTWIVFRRHGYLAAVLTTLLYALAVLYGQLVLGRWIVGAGA